MSQTSLSLSAACTSSSFSGRMMAMMYFMENVPGPTGGPVAWRDRPTDQAVLDDRTRALLRPRLHGLRGGLAHAAGAVHFAGGRRLVDQVGGVTRRRGQRGDHVLGVRRHAVLVQVQALELAFLGDAEAA